MNDSILRQNLIELLRGGHAHVTLDASWVSPDFPEGYWPKETDDLTEKAWEASVAAFSADLEEVIKLVEDESLDMTSEIPHGEGRTYR